jgi:CMP-N,N'-diacetyllegionaminic acid synthase
MSAPRVLGLVTARGGSKGIPDKNLLVLAGKSLLQWTWEAAKECSRLSRIVLSSDSEEICAAGRLIGFDVPFVRPADLARDDTPGTDPVLHALDALGDDFDYVVLLQPTSPLRVTSDIDGALDVCLVGGAPACVSVCEHEPSPYWSFTLEEAGRLRRLLDTSEIPARRQDLPPSFALNGALYVARVDWLRRERSFLGRETKAYVMPRGRSFDLDDDLDRLIIEALLQRGVQA